MKGNRVYVLVGLAFFYSVINWVVTLIQISPFFLLPFAILVGYFFKRRFKFIKVVDGIIIILLFFLMDGLLSYLIVKSSSLFIASVVGHFTFPIRAIIVYFEKPGVLTSSFVIDTTVRFYYHILFPLGIYLQGRMRTNK